MSLILGARFQNGILLASDPFVFDNDGDLPLKTLLFEKFYISRKLNGAMVSVGSGWVFQEFTSWIDSIDVSESSLIRLLPSKWAELNKLWVKKRVLESREPGGKTLRPVSESIVIIALASNLESIHIIDPDGNWSKTSTFAFSGSGSPLIEYFLDTSGKSFTPLDTLSQCFDLVKECYTVASKDLFVVGQPSLTLIGEGKTINLAKQCAQARLKYEQKYFSELKEVLLDSYFQKKQ